MRKLQSYANLFVNDEIQKKKKAKINLNELVKEVNTLDKKYGVKLKRKDIVSDPKKFRKRLAMSSDIIIGGIVCIINGINYEDYMITDDHGNIRMDGIMSPHFLYESNLDWDTRATYDESSIMFRCRFLSIVLAGFLNNQNSRANTVNELNGVNHSFEERKIIEIKESIDLILKFTKLMLNPKAKYGNTMLLMNEMCMSLSRRPNLKVSHITNKIIFEVKDGLEFDYLTGRRFLDDDLAICDLLQSGYVLSTNDLQGLKSKDLPQFKSIEGATLEHDLRLLIEAFGKKIRKSKELNPLFNAYISAHPAVTTQFGSLSHDLTIGCYALKFAGFIMDSKSADDIITDMLRTGKK